MATFQNRFKIILFFSFHSFVSFYKNISRKCSLQRYEGSSSGEMFLHVLGEWGESVGVNEWYDKLKEVEVQ